MINRNFTIFKERKRITIDVGDVCTPSAVSDLFGSSVLANSDSNWTQDALVWSREMDQSVRCLFSDRGIGLGKLSPEPRAGEAKLPSLSKGWEIWKLYAHFILQLDNSELLKLTEKIIIDRTLFCCCLRQDNNWRNIQE